MALAEIALAVVQIAKVAKELNMTPADLYERFREDQENGISIEDTIDAIEDEYQVERGLLKRDLGID